MITHHLCIPACILGDANAGAIAFLVCAGAFLLLLLGVYVGSIFATNAFHRRQKREEEELRSKLAAAGRLMPWDDVATRLAAGEGTLIYEYHAPKGPVHTWWTKEDAAELSPAPLPAGYPDPDEIPKPMQDYACACFARYVDLPTGSAKLTKVPKALGGPKVVEAYPKARVVSLISWREHWLIAQGDYETIIFSTSDENPGPQSAKNPPSGTSS